MLLKTKISYLSTFAFLFVMIAVANAQSKDIISKDDLLFLKGITQAVLDSSRIVPGQVMVEPFGSNKTGGTLIRPGGRATYPAFWVRDYAMSLETGLVTVAEQKHMLMLTAATQCDQTWITKGGSMVPYGAIADHILVENSIPVYFPGTYDIVEQGTPEFGRFPPYCDQFYFVKMAHHYIKTTNDLALLTKDINGTALIDRLEIAFKIPPAHPDNHIVYSTEHYRATDFGFRDAIHITGDLLYPSVLKYDAALELSDIFKRSGNTAKATFYKNMATVLKAAIPQRFATADGMLVASTDKSAQKDVWGTTLAIYFNILTGDAAKKASATLVAAYESGTLAYKGSVRHVIKTDDFSATTAWEGAIAGVPVNAYQNGSYWPTPVGWVAYALSLTRGDLAKKLVKEYITDLKETDFRKGSQFAGPLECFYPPSYTRGPVYLTSVSCPYIVLNAMVNKR